MVIDQLKESLIKYYKAHQSEYVQKVVLRYISNQYDPKMYDQLLQAILKSHPFNYGFPDVAAVEEASEKHYKKEGSSLRKPKPKKYWHMEGNEPIVDDDATGEGREKFLELVADATKHNKVKQDDKCQDCLHVTETGENYYCRGCIDHSKYEKKNSEAL